MSSVQSLRAKHELGVLSLGIALVYTVGFFRY